MSVKNAPNLASQKEKGQGNCVRIFKFKLLLVGEEKRIASFVTAWNEKTIGCFCSVK